MRKTTAVDARLSVQISHNGENMKAQQIKVSVIIPVYNSEKYLEECLNSVINQTLRDIEIICVDDGSTDNSLKILHEFAEHDLRINVIQQRHQFAGVARNTGMSYAQGEYLMFLDSDDFFEPAMLEEMYNSAVNNDAEVVICDSKVYRNGGLTPEKIAVLAECMPAGVFSCRDSEFGSQLFQVLLGVPWNKMFKRSFVQSMNIFFSTTLHYNDAAFTMGCVVAANRIIFVPKYFIYWRYREDSLIHMPKVSDSMYRSLKELYQNISQSDKYPLVERSFMNYVVNQLSHYYNYCQSEAIRLITIGFMKAFWVEFDMEKYPVEYFYQQEAYHQFRTMVYINFVPVA